MALSSDERKRLLVLLTLMSQGSGGRAALSAIQPILAIIEKQKADEQARKDANRAQLNSIAGQLGNTAGTLGGMYLVGRALAPTAAAAIPTTAAPAVATPTLLGAQTMGAGAAGTTAATSAAGATTAAGTAGTAGGMSLGAMGGLAALGAVGLNQLWEGGMKDILRGRGDRSDWINTGLMVGTGGIGGLPNLALRLMGKRSIGKMMTTGKSDAQLSRDDFRGVLKDKGIADNDYGVNLADGSKFNIGLDGHTKYSNTDGKTTRRRWDVDSSNPLANYAVSKIDPYIRQMYGDGGKGIHPEQYTGMVVNAVTSNAKNQADIDANIAAMFGAKPFEGNAPIRPAAAPITAASIPAPTAAPMPTPVPKQPMASPSFMAKPPAPTPQPVTMPPPTAPTPMPNAQQGLLSLQDQLKQSGQGKMDLNGLLNLIKNLPKQNGN